MEEVFNTLNSPSFAAAMYNLAIVAFVLALGLLAVAFTFYGRGREHARNPADENWMMLFASWRDSLIITLLFVTEGFGFDANAFQATSQTIPTSILFYAPVMQPLLSFVVHILIFVIAALRIVALSRWIAAKTL